MRSPPLPPLEIWLNVTKNTSQVIPPPPLTSPSPVVVDQTPPPHEPPLPPSGLENKTTLTALITGVGIGVVFVLLLVACIFAVRCNRKKRKLAASDGGLNSSVPQSPGYKDDHFLHCPQQRMQHNSSSAGSDNVVVNMPKPLSPDIMSFSQQFSGASLTPPPTFISCCSLSSDKKHQHTIPNCCVGLIKPTFTFEELESATDRFSSINILGQGGFGCVYKGVLHSGLVVAVKRLKHGSNQGEREFQAEVEMISRVQHRHLVSLVGYCTSGDQRLLVYEYVPNKTLDFHLHGDDCPFISWANRVKIALGSAKGLAYLHEECKPKIIHRDVKASNILLDDDFEAKVSDFGLARLSYDADTHVSTRVMGTFGYLAPEYALTGKLTEKSDVFSFGVMLLELITGRRPIDKDQYYLDDNIVDWARPLLSQALDDRNFDKVVDQRLQKDYDGVEMTRMVSCAAVCVRHLARHRPRMSQVVQALEGNMPLEDLNKGVKPGHSTVLGFHGTPDYDTFQYKEDLMKFKKMAFGSQEQNISRSSRDSNE